MTLFPKKNLFFLFFLLDSLRNIVWTVSNQYFGQPSRSTVDNLRYVLWSVSEKYCGQSPKTTSFYEVGIGSDIYRGQSPRIICILDVPSNPKHRVDHFHALTPMYIYSGQSPRIICILDVPSNPKHRVDHFHALTPMSCDAPCINAMQVSLHVISCYMYATSHIQHINHTLHV